MRTFLDLLEHVCDAASQRVAHQRLLAVVGELLVQDAPPAPGPPGVSPTVVWCSPGLARLFATLVTTATLEAPDASVALEDYRRLEEELLGPQDEDMFTSASVDEAVLPEAAVVVNGSTACTFVDV